MISAKKITDCIVEGIREEKGLQIKVIDLTKIRNTICRYSVICEGTSSTHVNAIATNLKEYVRETIGEKPLIIQGQDNREWIIMDYVQVIVHIMQVPARKFYDIEHLWEDANITEIPDL